MCACLKQNEQQSAAILQLEAQIGQQQQQQQQQSQQSQGTTVHTYTVLAISIPARAHDSMQHTLSHELCSHVNSCGICSHNTPWCTVAARTLYQCHIYIGVEHRRVPPSQHQQQQQQRFVSNSDQRDASPVMAINTNTDSGAARHSSSSGNSHTGAASTRQRTALQERSANTAATASAAKRSTTTAAAAHHRHRDVSGGDSDGSCNRENHDTSACSSVHSNDSDVLGGVRYVQVYEVCMSLCNITAAFQTVPCVSMRVCSLTTAVHSKLFIKAIILSSNPAL